MTRQRNGKVSINADELILQYAEAMRAYLADPDEASLEIAYEFGRAAIRSGLGVIELAKAHGRVVYSLLSHARSPAELKARSRLASAFFQECLWAFEMIHRGFRDSNQLLRDLNGSLEARARQLRDMNEALSRENAERRHVEDALRRSEDSLRQLSRQILVAQEEERKRISRELHDEVGQALTAINMNLTMLQASLETQSAARKVADLQGLLQQTMETVHSVTRELRPAMLDHLGLVPSLRAYVRNFRKRTGLHVRFTASKDVEALGIEEKTVLYRVSQEGLTNVARHAEATLASICIRKQGTLISMELHDNGKAFRVQSVVRGRARRRFGLIGIQERVRLVGGDFSIESEPGKGTLIRVQIPIKIHAKQVAQS